MTAAHQSPIPHIPEWVALADVVHAVLADELDGGCPDNRVGDGGLCHDIAESVINHGWRR